MRKRPRGEDESLVGRLYDAHGPSLYRYAVMLLADPAAAEDAVQQVFAALLKRRGLRLDNEAHYLRRAVRNECYSFLRRPMRVSSPGELALLEQLPDTGDGISPEERLTLEQALRTLPVEQRDVVHLHAFEGMTLQEVADVCGESLNTVASPFMQEDIEELLRRYRPVPPPAQLRDRCTRLARGRTWPWAVACAAALVLAVTLQSLIHGLADRQTFPADAATEQEAANHLAEMLGGDAEARRFAAVAMRELRFMAQATAPGGRSYVSGWEQ